MAEEEDKETLINRLDMRSINNELTKLFQTYSMVLNKILGDELIGNSQIREIYTEQSGVFKEYSKGQIAFKNGIDKLRYLLDHRARVSKLIGVSSYDIYNNKRELAKVKEYINRLQGVCEMGDVQYPIQMYISKHDGNIGNLDSHTDWVDYILTQTWIDKLASKASGGEYSPSDYRIEYLADLIEGKMADHEIAYHKSLAEFTPSDFLSKGREDGVVKYKLEDAMNMLNSFGKLDYGFYEIFKPIGGGKGKHIKVKMSTDGYVDISGVVGLNDCIHWEWEYGSEAYLRSLNTGNQRYLLQLDQPFNDESSTLWWKPDETTPPQKIEIAPSEDDETPQPTVWNFRPYETERFLRWYGNDHVPQIDEKTLEKCTVCSSPTLSNDTQADNFHTDARNIGDVGIDLTRTSIDNSTSQSLLSLYPKATIAIRRYVRELVEDETNVYTYREPEESDPEDNIHQYIEFVVTGNRQTYNVAFNVRARVRAGIQEPNHYLHTLKELTDEWHRLYNTMLFLEVGAIIEPELKTIWESLVSSYNFDEPWIPENWTYLEDKFRTLLNEPTAIDLLRFRQLDTDTIIKNNDVQIGTRLFGYEIDDEKSIPGFLLSLSLDNAKDKEDFINTYCKGDQKTKDELYRIVKNKKFLKGNEDGPDEDDNDEREALSEYRLRALKKYIDKFEGAETYTELDKYFTFIGLTNTQKENLVKKPLIKMYGVKEEDEEKEDTIDPFADVTVEMLRERISTFLSLIVRLPVNSESNCRTSRRIFQDWKAFVDGALEYLCDPERGNELNKSSSGIQGIGSDEKTYNFYEYTSKEDGKPLVDYSWLYGREGPMHPYVDDDKTPYEEGCGKKPIGDRWDYWRVEDFNWPQ